MSSLRSSWSALDCGGASARAHVLAASAAVAMRIRTMFEVPQTRPDVQIKVWSKTPQQRGWLRSVKLSRLLLPVLGQVVRGDVRHLRHRRDDLEDALVGRALDQPL